MPAFKFSVFTTNRLLYTISKLPSFKHHLRLFDKTLHFYQNSKSDSNIRKYRSNPYETCKRNAEILARRSRRARIQQTCKKQNGIYKCESMKIISEYEISRKRINDLIEEITQLLKAEKQIIVESMRNKAKIDKDKTCEWLKNISNSIDRKLETLIQLDPCAGSEIRMTVLRYKDHARNTFITLHSELTPSVKQIELMLEEIQIETSQSLEKAASLTLFCRCEGSPSIFRKCVLNNMIEAERCLEQTMRETKAKLREVKKLRDFMLNCHEKAVNEETNYHLSEMKVLSQYLDRCIVTLKRRRI